MSELLDWYYSVSTTKAFGWARLTSFITGLLVIWFCHSVANGRLDWALMLVVPIYITASTSLELLAHAHRVATLAARLQKGGYTAGQSGIIPATGPVYTSPTAPPETGGEAGNQPAPEPGAAAETGPQSYEELTEEARLALCQFYSFLYAVVGLRKVGEGKLTGLLGIPARKYRQWIRALADPQLGIVGVQTGKVILLETDFEAALGRVARYKAQPRMWDFPRAVYGLESNWRVDDPAVSRLDGIEIRAYRRTGTGGGRPYPRYPQHLSDLNLDLTSVEVEG